MTNKEFEEWLNARTERQENGCLFWLKALNGAGHPVASVAGHRAFSVRSAVFHRSKRPIIPGTKVMMRCRNEMCLNLECMEQVDSTTMMHILAAEGRYESAVTRMRLSKAVRKNSRYASQIPRVKQMIAEGRVYREITAETGVSRSVISRVKQGAIWRDNLLTNSVHWAIMVTRPLSSME